MMVAQPFLESLRSVHAQVSTLEGGTLATYIPELAKADPNHFAIAIATIDGEVYSVGDADIPLTIQSMSKPFAFAAALERFGHNEMLKRVGVEPTGDAFNSIVLDESNRRPFNPMVNAGAIAVSALFPGDNAEERNAAMLGTLSRFAGRDLSIDESVFRSEAATGHRNRAIAYLLLNSGMLEADPASALDTYFRQCSALVTTRDLATMAATLANGGINPKTRVRALSEEHVPDVLTVMLTCGMYDYAGQWAYEAGLPAKSGVSGGVLAVVPGQFGIAAYSPKLDRFGNSVRAVAACRQLSNMYSLHSFRRRVGGDETKGREWSCLDLRSRRWRPPHEAQILDTKGDRILVLEARGDLSIASTERILRSAGSAASDGRVVILDLKGVTGIDSGAARLFADFGQALASADSFVFLTQPHERWVLDRLRGADGNLPAKIILQGNLDLALESAENSVLAATGLAENADEVPAERAALFRGMDEPNVRKMLDQVAPLRREYAKGASIVRRGDPTDMIYAIASGSITVRLPSSAGPEIRISALGPGAVFGEMGLIDGSPRSADVVAESDAVCWALPIAAMKSYLERDLAAMNAILANLVTDLSERLRRSNRMVMSLA